MATTSVDRIVSLDLIRGFAVLGIFSVNIIGMAFWAPVYFQPVFQGFDSLGDKLMYLVNFVLVDGKLRSLFSMLFGASMLLVIDKAVQAGRSGWKTHYSRIFWLLIIGLIHFYIFWWGDILSHYAIIGMIAYLWRNCRPKTLAIWAAVLLTFNVGFGAYQTYEQRQRQQQAQAEREAQPEAQEEEAAPPAIVPGSVPGTRGINPDGPPIEPYIDAKAKHQSLVTHTRDQIEHELTQPFMVSLFLLPETLGLMLLGMSLYRYGYLTGDLSDRTYRRWALIALGGGILYTSAVAAWIATNGFAPPFAGMGRNMLTTWTRPLMAMGYAAFLILITRKGLGWWTERLAAAGRMAFTNYLGATLVMTPIMFGFGFGLFGELTRGTAWLFVPPVWLAMLVGSKWWLERYRYGPLEWVWRSLARWQLQPMRKVTTAV